MSEQWFDPDELGQMSRPTMDRAIEAVDRGDLDEARALCSEMRHGWWFLHDLMAEQLLGLVTFIQERFGEDYVGDAWRLSMERGWRRDLVVG